MEIRWILITFVITMIMAVHSFPCAENNQCQCSYQAVHCDNLRKSPRFAMEVRLGKDLNIRVDDTDFDVNSLDYTYGFEHVVVETKNEMIFSAIKLHHWWVECRVDGPRGDAITPPTSTEDERRNPSEPERMKEGAAHDEVSNRPDDDDFYSRLNAELNVDMPEPTTRPKTSKITIDMTMVGEDQSVWRTENLERFRPRPATVNKLNKSNKKSWTELLADPVVYSCIAGGVTAMAILVFCSCIVIYRKENGHVDNACIVNVSEFTFKLICSPCACAKMLIRCCKKVCCCGCCDKCCNKRKRKSSDIQMKNFSINSAASSMQSVNSASEIELFNRAEYDYKRL